VHHKLKHTILFMHFFNNPEVLSSPKYVMINCVEGGYCYQFGKFQLKLLDRPNENWVESLKRTSDSGTRNM
jgi:hypothetical protein